MSDLFYLLKWNFLVATCRIYNAMTGTCQAILTGHEGEISKVIMKSFGFCGLFVMESLDAHSKFKSDVY